MAKRYAQRIFGASLSKGRVRWRAPARLATHVISQEDTSTENEHPPDSPGRVRARVAPGGGERARVAPAREHRARVAPGHRIGPSGPAAQPPTRSGLHRGRPLFVLGTARRRRSTWSTRRGGYYAISSGRKQRGAPPPIKVVLALSGGILLFSLALVVLVGISLYGGYLYFSRDLPSVDNIHAIEFETTHIYDRNGRLLYEMYDTSQGKRNYVTIDQLPHSLISATIAVEDSSFQQNSGVDPRGIARAVYINLTNQGSSGGSTITQQLVRRVLLPERDELTFSRKIREAILAVRVTEKYSKDKILEIYLNEISYGSLSYGVDAAANTYFGKRVQDLTLAESAMLAGLPQAPSEYDPNLHFNMARARQKIVLDLMVENHFITQAEADTAYSEDVHPIRRAANLPKSAPHFVEYVRQELERKYGEEMANRGGLKVFTTIDLDWQAEAQRIAVQQIDNIKRQGASNAGLVAINPRTGEILAMVGSVDYTDPNFGQVNVATSLRQPGSSFKPFTYATALQSGDWTPDSYLADMPVKFGNGPGQLPYVPQNYDGRFHGPVTIRSALANSYNIPAVEMLKEVGIPAVLDTVHKMGITTLNDPKRYGLSLTLGGGEVTLLDMTAAFSAFANYGYHVPATPFLKITDPQGKVLEELNTERPVGGKQVLDPGVAYQISDILSDNEARTPMFGPNSPLKIDGIQAAAKTGTTNDWKDSWTMGYTPALAVGVWVGNNDGRPMAHVAGAIGAAPIWHDFIKKVYSDPKLKARLLKPTETDLPSGFKVPPGMVHAAVCAISGMAPGPACTHVKWDWFTQANLPEEECTWHEWVTVTLHDGGATVAGPGVPNQDTIQRIFTFPPAPFKGYFGSGPPITVTNAVTAEVALPTPVAIEPPSIAGLVTAFQASAGAQRSRPAGVSQPGNAPPIPDLQLAITSPAEGQVVNGSVIVLGQASSSDFARYRLEKVDPSGQTTNVLESASPATGVLGIWTTDGLPAGLYTLRLTLETQSGQAARVEIGVKVHYTSPSVSITSPADGSPVYIGEAIEIDVAADGGGAPLAGVEIYADGRRLVSLANPPWSARWAVITGTHELAAVAYTTEGERAQSPPVRVTSAGLRPTPTPTISSILWISNLTLYEEVPAGVNNVWVDVAPDSPVKHVDIYVDGFPAGYATGPGYRVNPAWTATPTAPPTPPATVTLEPGAASTATALAEPRAATATAVKQAANAQATRSARAAATKAARSAATATAAAVSARATAEIANATATVMAATASPTPLPPTQTPTATPTATFVRYSRLPDPLLGDYVARCMLAPGTHRITAIGYDELNREVARDETWVVVK